MNPATHWGSGIDLNKTTGLSTGLVLGKAFSKFAEEPQLIEARRFMINCNPLSVRAAPLCNIRTPSFQTFHIYIDIYIYEKVQGAKVIRSTLRVPSTFGGSFVCH